jgi:hypothetical protein
VEHPELILQKDIFQTFPCIRKPCSISPRRRTALQQLCEIFGKEVFLSDFYLFSISPFVIDLKNMAGEGLEGIPVSENGKATLPHHRLEEIISQRLGQGGYLDDWEARIRKLDQADGFEDLIKMKRWTDQIALASGGFSLSIVYQFDKNRLHPIRFCK